MQALVRSRLLFIIFLRGEPARRLCHFKKKTVVAHSAFDFFSSCPPSSEAKKSLKSAKKKEELLAVTVFGRTVVFGSICILTSIKKSNNCDLLPCYLPYLTP